MVKHLCFENVVKHWQDRLFRPADRRNIAAVLDALDGCGGSAWLFKLIYSSPVQGIGYACHWRECHCYHDG